MDDKFKISAFAVGEPQTIELVYSDFKESDKFPGNYNTLIIHNGIKKWWSFSSMVRDKMIGQGAAKGVKFIVTRKEGKEGRTVTDVVAAGVVIAGPLLDKQITNVTPDWDNIALGKCRTLFAVEAFKLGLELNTETAATVNKWAQFSVSGQFETIKKSAKKPKSKETAKAI